MNEVTKIIKIRIPATPAERKQLRNTIITYKRACDYVSKHVRKTHELRYTYLYREISYDLRDMFDINTIMIRSVIKTVTERYDEKYGDSNRRVWRRIKFKRQSYTPYWNLDYILTEDEFYINTVEGKLEYSPLLYDRCFGIFSVILFGTAELIKRGTKYYIEIPVTFDLEEMELRVEKWFYFMLWILWKPMKRYFLENI